MGAMAEQKQKRGWLARRREKRRLKREQGGDSPEKRAEGKRPGDPADSDGTEVVGRAGTIGFLGG